MNQFYKALTHVNKIFYEPNHLTIHDIQEEAQNSEYGAGMFQLNSTSVRFRVAKITPNKIGQFVAFWEKDGDGKNQAFSYEKAADLLVINTFASNHHFGQFVFPKEVLVSKISLKQPLQKEKWQLEFTLNGKIPLANKLSKHKNGSWHILLRRTMQIVFQHKTC